jgi:MDMPI C-terminal domain
MGPASYWARRMAHETAVHRADGQLTVGIQPLIDPVIAADGIDEWLGFGTESGGPGPALPEGKVLHLHATDEGLTGEWLIRGGPDGIAVEAGHGKGDAAVRGPASALLLLLVRRLAPDDPAVEVIGDRAVLDGWLAATPF